MWLDHHSLPQEGFGSAAHLQLAKSCPWGRLCAHSSVLPLAQFWFHRRVKENRSELGSAGKTLHPQARLVLREFKSPSDLCSVNLKFCYIVTEYIVYVLVGFIKLM